MYSTLEPIGALRDAGRLQSSVTPIYLYDISRAFQVARQQRFLALRRAGADSLAPRQLPNEGGGNLSDPAAASPAAEGHQAI